MSKTAWVCITLIWIVSTLGLVLSTWTAQTYNHLEKIEIAEQRIIITYKSGELATTDNTIQTHYTVADKHGNNHTLPLVNTLPTIKVEPTE